VAEFIGTGTVLRGTIERQSSADPATARFAARFRSGVLTFDVVAEREGDAFAVLRPVDLTLSRTPLEGPAPRNRFAAVVSRIERETAVAQVHLDVGETALVATVMTATVDEMGLTPGAPVSVAIKATAIHII